ncbi:type I-B CRISPR-associated endonuclease Cas1 [Candidatus Woesearchaeota archaeon]|nr:type I-B CRISPR-associated endonuclease Cas1 [Candidatus Woesearchaeota archaeon]
MPKRNFYITKSGTIKRKHNTVWFENEKIKKAIPLNNIDSIYCLGQVSVNSKLLTYLTQNGIIMHFFNYYGYYSGTYFPRKSLVSGSLVVKQVKHYEDSVKRLIIAKEIVKSTLENLIRILEHYRKHKKKVNKFIEKIKDNIYKIKKCNNIPELMNVEGNSWNTFYASYEEIILNKFKFKKRTKRPPENEINCLISFLNSMLYTKVLSEIYHTQLNPTISYLHEPFERRFSLALDLSEMFKPLITQRALLKLVNKKEIKQKHFRIELKGCLLNEYGKKIVIKEFDERLRRTKQHPGLKRKVSYRRLMRVEAYKLVKHLLGEKEYDGFKIWW